MRTFLCILSMVYGLREICVFAVCLKIRLFALYGRLYALRTIISGTPQNVHISEYKRFLFDSYSHLCCVFSFV